MKIAHRSIFAMTAEDVMSRNVQIIPETMSLPAAAGVLAREQISGAPVVDDEGHCVGVLSATDFVRLAEKNSKSEDSLGAARATFASEWEVINADALPPDEVRAHMSLDVVTVGRGTRMQELARTMLDAHIHRVIVVDAERRPIGIVTSTDVLGAVAYADEPIEE